MSTGLLLLAIAAAEAVLFLYLLRRFVATERASAPGRDVPQERSARALWATLTTPSTDVAIEGRRRQLLAVLVTTVFWLALGLIAIPLGL